MSFIAKNPLTIPEVESSPSVPKSGTRGLFAGKDGWYDVDSDEHTRKIATEDDTKTKEEIQNKIPGGAKPITEAYADDMGMVNNSTYPSMKYLAESFEKFRDEISDDLVVVVDDLTTDDGTQALSAKQGKVLNDSKESVSNKILSEVVKSLGLQESEYTDSQYLSAKGAAHMVNILKGSMERWLENKEEVSRKIGGGNTPITIAYADGEGMINNTTYPSTKYLAESLEQFRKEIGSGDNFVEKLSAYGLASLSEFNIPDVDDFCVLKIQDSESGEQTDVSFYNCVQTAEKLSSKVDTDLLRYYEEVVTPTDASLFEYVMEGNTWCITGYKGTGTDIVIPYEINGTAVTSIGSWAFWSNTALSSVIIPNSITTIASDAFRGCSNLKSVTIPDSVITIANDAFMDCDSLTSITIPDSVTTIPVYVFNNCASLKSIKIPSSVTTIGVNAFSGCDALTVICDQGSCAEEYCKANNIKYVLDTVSPDSLGGGGSVNLDNYYTKNQVDDKLEDKADADLLYYYGEIVTPTDASLFNFDSATGAITGYKGNKADVVIPYEINGVKVTKIKDNAFKENSVITSVIIPNSVTDIGYTVFAKCTKLKKVVLPKSITAIKGNVFSECSALESINIPNGVTTIWDYAFYKCTKLASLELPESLVGIDAGAFSNTGLKKIKIPMTEGRITSGALSGNSTDLVVHCSQGSPVETYCKTNNIKYVFDNIDGNVYANLLATIEALQAKSIVKMVSIDLPASAWIEDGTNQFHQVVEIDGTTPYSKVDLQPTTEQLVIFHQKDITFVTENIDGVITVYCIGQMPLLDYTIQATITEVV